MNDKPCCELCGYFLCSCSTDTDSESAEIDDADSREIDFPYDPRREEKNTSSYDW